MKEIFPVESIDHAVFTEAFNAIKRGRPDLSFNGKPVTLKGLLGQGGTKDVFDAILDGDAVALALPNIIDTPQVAIEKWCVALREPPVTSHLRDLEFVVNTRCEVTRLHVDGIAFPSLTFNRFEDLPVEVRDHKNNGPSADLGYIFPTKPTLSSFLDTSVCVAKDAARLVSNGIVLGSDSFNLARDTNGLRLFLNDLGGADVTDLSEEETVQYAHYASRSALDALVGGLSSEEHKKHRDFFRGEDFHFKHGKALKHFTAIVLSEAGIA